MIWALFKDDIRSIRTIWIIMTAVFIMYFAVVILIYDPQSTFALVQMLDMFPEALLKAFGLATIGNTLLTFLTGYMYGFLVLMIPMVISIICNHRLIADHVERGSMAYLLSSPNSRLKIAVTQVLFSLFSMAAFFTTVTIAGLAIANVILPGGLDAVGFISVNLYALVMYFAVGGIGFFVSCLSDSKVSLGLGIGIPLGFLILQMIGSIGDKFSWVGNLSLFTLFDPNKLARGSGSICLETAIFLVIAAVTYIGAMIVFNKRDFHV